MVSETNFADRFTDFFQAAIWLADQTGVTDEQSLFGMARIFLLPMEEQVNVVAQILGLGFWSWIESWGECW
jgi:hypothetical protein